MSQYLEKNFLENIKISKIIKNGEFYFYLTKEHTLKKEKYKISF